MPINFNTIVVLILSTTKSEYHLFKEAIRKTWLRDFQRHDIKCFFYEGGAKENKLVDDTIMLTAPDGIYDVSEKFVAALKFVFEHYPETQLIYRTNLSSYIDIHAFSRFVIVYNLNDRTYSGCIGSQFMMKELFYKYKFLYFLLRFISFGKKIQFASGSGFFLGSSHCKKLLTSEINLDLVDDVMVADTIKILPDANIVPQRFDLGEESSGSLSVDEFTRLVEQEHLFHFRFKTKDRVKDAALLQRFGDAEFRKSYCTKGINSL